MSTPNYFTMHGLKAVVYKPFTTVPVIVEELLAHLAAHGRSPRHRDTLRLLLRRFAGWWPKAIGELTAADVRAFLASLAPIAPRTANNWIASLRTLARFAIKRRYLPKFWDELDTLDRFTETPEPVVIYTPDEVARVLRHCSAPFLPVALLTAFAGVRNAEALRLTWDDVDLPRRLVTVSAARAKTRARRVCPIPENLATWLARCERVGALYTGKASSFHEGLRRAHRKAGVVARVNGLRHSFVSYRLALNPSVDAVALVSGNSPGMIFRHYRELVTPEAAREFFSIRPENGQMELKLAA